MRAQRSFAERVEIMVNATKLTQMQQKELNDKLISAAKDGNIKRLRDLIGSMANVDGRDEFGRTALHEAALNGHVDISKFLIENGVDVNAKNKYGETALHEATWRVYVKVVKVLIEKGADVDATDDFGRTALHYAAWRGHVNVAKVLIEKGANVNVKNKNNETAVEVAIRRGYHQIAELIENSKKICSNNVDPEKENKIDIKNIDILSMDMDELVRRADESAMRLRKKEQI